MLFLSVAVVFVVVSANADGPVLALLRAAVGPPHQLQLCYRLRRAQIESYPAGRILARVRALVLARIAGVVFAVDGQPTRRPVCYRARPRVIDSDDTVDRRWRSCTQYTEPTITPVFRWMRGMLRADASEMPGNAMSRLQDSTNDGM